ncbi:MAG: cysteine--tRNA ligase [Candidatus Bathyarchaeia archaeon]|jgi:cysteinyl-tRNA synthetase
MESEHGNIQFFNSLTREKEKFVPIENGKVKMYTCGLTVYDYGHIGNYRAFIFEDLLRRWLEYRGFKVTQVMNVTDVDDRAIKAASKSGAPLKEYTERYTKAFFEDIGTLKIEKAEFYPKATENVPEMVALITKLMEKGYAYKGDDGSIYYEISKFKDYGKLANIKVENLKPSARVKVDEYAKEQAQDFALWKAWTEEDGDVFWETPLGKGRPGWHIECSAMAMKYLGQTLDIHCGGVDNLFPHHENEIAQSESATGKKFVNYWLHNEHLLIEGKKMAKSLGNFYTVRDLTAKGYDPKAIRYLLLATHYRQQVNFTFEGLEGAKKTLDRLTNFAHRLLEADGKSNGNQIGQLMSRVRVGFEAAMDDDLSISEALASLFDFVRDVNILLDENSLSKDEAQEVYHLMVKFDKVLGVVGEIKSEQELPKDAEELILKREEARKAKDWKTADAIRQQLKGMGILVEDTPQGVKWRDEKHQTGSRQIGKA